MDFESLCKRCGLCCGLGDDDPCVHLKKETGEMYSCAIYENRLGPRKTASGKTFNCVPILDMVRIGATYPECAYNFLAECRYDEKMFNSPVCH